MEFSIASEINANPPASDFTQNLAPTEPQKTEPGLPQETQQESLSQNGPQTPSQAELAAMKDKIQKLMRMDNLADITLAGYMIKLCRQRGKMSFRELHDEVSKCYDTLRRSDGSKYTGDLAKALKGCLTSSEIFKEVGENVWGIREKEAKLYEEKTTKKLKTLINKKKGRSGRKKGTERDEDIESDEDISESEDEDGDSPGLVRSAPVKKVKQADKYQKVYNMLELYAHEIKGNEGTKNLLKSPFDNFIEGEAIEDAWKKVGYERFLGALECFEYFRPMLQDYMNQNEIQPAENNGARKTAGKKPATGTGNKPNKAKK